MQKQFDEGALLVVNDLVKHFTVRKGWVGQRRGVVKAVDGISFQIKRGETLGLVGESGCGKTTTGRCILRVIEPTRGQIWFNDRDAGWANVAEHPSTRLKRLRRDMQMIFQDPYSSLNPRRTLKQIVGEPLVVHGIARGSDLEEVFLRAVEGGAVA